MKILNIVILLLIFNSNSYAQNSKDEFKKIKNEVLKDFSEIKSYELSDLIPFSINRNWGLINRKNNKVVIPAKYGKLNFFNPNMRGFYIYEGFEVNADGYIHFDGDKPDEEIRITEVDASSYADLSVKIISSSSGFKGFKVDEKGVLIEYSDIYKNQDTHSRNLLPFKKDNKFYAVALSKNGKYGIIDTSGNTIKGFDFIYERILLNSYSKDKSNLWCFVQKNDLWSLKSFNEKVKFENEIISPPYSTTFGLARMEKDGVYAIFDCYEMKWLKKPTSKKIGWIYYSSKKELDKNIPNERENASIYISAEEDDLKYYIDLKGKKIIPKK